MPIGSIHRTALYAVSGLQTSTVSVAASNRNAEHHPPTGHEYNNALDSRGICFGRNVAGELQAGFEFALPVPQGAVVTSASLTFTATLTQSGSPAATVRCYDVDDAPPFNSLSNISLTMYAPLTAAGVSWSPTAFTPDQIYTTPDLAPVLQEVVSRPGYASNHHVGFVFEGAPTSGAAWRCVKNYASGKPPVLTVTYTAPPPPPCGFTNYGYAGAPPAHNLGLTGSGCPRVNTTIGFVTSHVKSAGAWTLLCEGEGHMPFFDGFVLVDPNRYVLGDFVPSSNGTAMWNVSIPNDPHFVGYVLFGQSLAFDPSIPQGLAFSNGLTAVVCP
jgi:hypothetical protein